MAAEEFCGAPGVIDRKRVVRRHNPVIMQPHPVNTLSVGNGDLAVTVDISGLQTFPDFHELQPDPLRVADDGSRGLPEQRERPFSPDDFQIPLRTQSSWGWYATRTGRDLSLEEAITEHQTPRGPVPYLDRMGLQRAADPIPEELSAAAWFAYNPRRMHLGRLTLDARAPGPAVGHPEELKDARAELDLWSGTVEARYRLNGVPVEVTTSADPTAYRFATRIRSELLRQGLAVSWVFDSQRDDLAPFELPVVEGVTWDEFSPGTWVARRVVESTTYTVQVDTTGVLSLHEGGTRVTAATEQDELEVVVTLRPEPGHGTDQPPCTFAAVSTAAAAWWEDYWLSGAAVSFSGSTDVRAGELERRVVLSQYLLAVNSAGATPPAETGLTYNTWCGKFHLEMHWWHAAHFPLWGRGALLERSLDWYHRVLPAARETARRQGYKGARWPKQTDPSARESPSHIGVFLVWQQPHLIHLLELLYSEGRQDGFLEQHYPLVEATADFMVDFVEERDGGFILPPPLIPAQESYLVDRETNASPTFELAYWCWALQTANVWRQRLNLPPREDWNLVGRHMQRPRLMPDGTYAALATQPYLLRKDHPSILMALGWLPDTDIIDAQVMEATLESVWQTWDLQTSWGWDYPVMSMTASRLGDIERALAALLLTSPKNQFLTNGHNPQIPGFLTLYLPANGGLLAAVAHIAAAIEQGAVLPPGWSMRAEGFSTLPRFSGATTFV